MEMEMKMEMEMEMETEMGTEEMNWKEEVVFCTVRSATQPSGMELFSWPRRSGIKKIAFSRTDARARPVLAVRQKLDIYINVFLFLLLLLLLLPPLPLLAFLGDFIYILTFVPVEVAWGPAAGWIRPTISLTFYLSSVSSISL